MRQWENLKVAYSTAAGELADIYEQLPTVDEHEWPGFVAEVEAVISNEHTAWLASRPGTA